MHFFNKNIGKIVNKIYAAILCKTAALIIVEVLNHKYMQFVMCCLNYIPVLPYIYYNA